MTSFWKKKGAGSNGLHVGLNVRVTELHIQHNYTPATTKFGQNPFSDFGDGTDTQSFIPLLRAKNRVNETYTEKVKWSEHVNDFSSALHETVASHRHNL